MFCCPNCFTHTYLKTFINNSCTEQGICSFCNYKKPSPLCKPSKLIDLFQPILDLYAEDSVGNPLNKLLQSDWNIFSEFVDDKKQLSLISRISDFKYLSRKRYLSRLALNNSFIDKWDAFAHELKHENRFFPKSAIDPSQLSELFNYLIIPKENNPRWIYRARITRQSKVLTISELGKPPREESQDGRANPKGISYFYGASDYRTAIAETRPYKSENISVAKFRVNGEINLVDLRDPRSTISPFGLDDDNLSLLYEEHMPFLGHLGAALSKPILPYKKELEYLPTQYLCELIKNNKFDGIVFKSSLEKGDNYVFFDDSVLVGTKVETYFVSDTTINSIKMTKKKK